MLRGKVAAKRTAGWGLAACLISGCQGGDPGRAQEVATDGGHVSQEVIYGEDGRKDTYEVTDSSVLTKAASSVALIKVASLQQTTGGLRVKAEAYGPANNLCRDERFYNQQAGAFCSGSLIGSNLILTAGHCVQTASDCRETRFVFDYAVDHGAQTEVTVEAANVYACAEILHSEVLSSGSDFAVVRLDRPVLGGRIPLSPRASGAISTGEDVYVIGHPAGLPQKITSGGKVRSLKTEHFVTDLDTYGGNSGSPVFNARTGDLEGVLVRGEQDFASRGSCAISNRCADGKCRGEDVTRISRALAYFDEGSTPDPEPTPVPTPTPPPQITEYANTSVLVIPDNDTRGVVSPLRADQGPDGRAVRVAIDIEHTYRGDLIVVLIAPDGQSVTIHSRSGGSSDNLIGVWDLPKLSSLRQSGTWELKISDQARADKGRLRSWKLIFE